MDWSLVTRLVVFLTPIILALYDIITFHFGGNDATISKQLLNIDSVRPALCMLFAYTFGLLCGHLFLPQHVQ